MTDTAVLFTQSWAGINVEQLRWLMLSRMRSELLVFLCIASYADPYGLAFPSPRHIAETIGHSIETIERAVNRLIELDYIRAWYYIDPEMRRGQWRYQVAPSILTIRPELQLTVYEQFQNRPKDPVIFVLMKDHDPKDPTTDPTTRSNAKNQRQNQRQQPTARPEVSGAASVQNFDPTLLETQDGENQNLPDSQRQSKPAAEKNHAEQGSPNSAAHQIPHPSPTPPRPGEPDMFEQVVRSLRMTAPEMPTNVAVELVSEYGEAAALKALELIQQQTTVVANPAGWLRSMIPNLVSKHSNSSARYTNGKYAEYVEK